MRVLVRVQCASACGVGSWGRERGVAGAGGGWLVVVLVRGELDLFSSIETQTAKVELRIPDEKSQRARS